MSNQNNELALCDLLFGVSTEAALFLLVDFSFVALVVYTLTGGSTAGAIVSVCIIGYVFWAGAIATQEALAEYKVANTTKYMILGLFFAPWVIRYLYLYEVPKEPQIPDYLRPREVPKSDWLKLDGADQKKLVELYSDKKPNQCKYTLPIEYKPAPMTVEDWLKLIVKEQLGVVAQIELDRRKAALKAKTEANKLDLSKLDIDGVTVSEEAKTKVQNLLNTVKLENKK